MPPVALNTSSSMAQLTQDWKFPLQASNFIGFMPEPGEREPSGTVLRCITLTRIPCTHELALEHNITRVNLAVVRVMKKGWVNAPYKRPKVNAKTGVAKTADKELNTKPLFEDFTYAKREGVKVFNYSKANAPSDKGPRVDSCFGVVCPGQTLTFSIRSEFVFKENAFPKDIDIIEPYQMVDLVIAPSSIDQAKNGDKGGYGIKMVRVRMHDSSVYSYVKDFPLIFEHSAAAAQKFVQVMLQSTVPIEASSSSCEPGAASGEESSSGEGGGGADDQQQDADDAFSAKSVILADTIRNCIDNKAPMYYVQSDKLCATAFSTEIRPDLEFFRIQPADASDEVFPGVQRVDLHIPTVLRLFNTDDKVYARTLLDFSIAASALSLLCTTDEWFQKNDNALATTRAIPIVNLSRLFQDVHPAKFDPSLEYVDFPVSFTPPPTIESLAICVPMCSKPVVEGAKDRVETADFMLVAPGTRLERAYEVQFVENDDALLTTYFNPKAGRSFGGGDLGVPTVYQRTSRKRLASLASE